MSVFTRPTYRHLLAMLLLLLAACGGQNEQGVARKPADSPEAVPAVRELSAEEVRTLIAEHPETPVIDVRTAPEFTGPLGHIEGARLLTLQDIDTWAPTLSQYADEDIVLVCRSGNRSGVAAGILAQRGFSRLINMTGGMRDWNRREYPVVSGSSQGEE